MKKNLFRSDRNIWLFYLQNKFCFLWWGEAYLGFWYQEQPKFSPCTNISEFLCLLFPYNAPTRRAEKCYSSVHLPKKICRKIEESVKCSAALHFFAMRHYTFVQCGTALLRSAALYFTLFEAYERSNSYPPTNGQVKKNANDAKVRRKRTCKWTNVNLTGIVFTPTFAPDRWWNQKNRKVSCSVECFFLPLARL